MTGFLLGLGVAFCGALLLASGSELQSRAVHLAGGRWRTFLRSPGWLGGLGLLAIAVSTNFVALALTPVSAVQSVSVVALAASAAFGALTGRVVVTRGALASIALSAAGILTVIAIIAAHRTPDATTDLDARLAAVTVILAVLTALGTAAALLGRRGGRGIRLCGLVVGSMVFGSVTTVFKAVVTLVLVRGAGAALTAQGTLLALCVVAAGGVIANVLLQRSHRAFPAPVVVAGLTIIDPLTAAVVGIAVLGEAALGPLAILGLCGAGAAACAGVLGLGRLRRRVPAQDVATPEAVAREATADRRDRTDEDG